MANLLSVNDPRYLRRLARAINEAAGSGVVVKLATGEVRRVRAAKFSGGLLQVRTLGSDAWFAASADTVEGCCASREAR
jgi:hypothetical protein